jgi:hypothetical protein
MDYIILFLFVILILYAVKKMLITTSTLWLMIGLIGIFSIGYYILPVLFKTQSGLNKFDEYLLSEVLIMSLFFFFFIILGAISGENYFNKKKLGLKYDMLNGIFSRNYKIIFFISLIIWIIYYMNVSITSYNVDDTEAYFREQNTFAGIIAFFSNFAMAAMALIVALMFSKGDESNKNKYLYLLIFLGLSLLLLSTAQRFAVIKPIFMLVAAFYIFGNKKMSLKLMAFGIVFLFVISPLMVFLREFDRTQATTQTIETMKKFQQSSKAKSSFESILDRADLLKVMINLKKYFEKPYYKFDPIQYYSSVIASFIPKIIYPYKAYPLSDTGTIDGELSVIAWKQMVGRSIGSLTAFGSISAYREGGYIWVLINGFLVGYLFSFINSFLTRGDLIGKFLFITLFVTLCVKNVPPSLSYVLVFIAPTFHIIIMFYFLNLFLRRYKK